MGLLTCQNDQKKLSTNETHRKPWNHDLAAALNFRKILFGLREKGERLKLFCRPNQAATTKKKKKKKDNPNSSSNNTKRPKIFAQIIALAI